MNIIVLLAIVYVLAITFIVWKKDGTKSGILILGIFGIVFLFNYFVFSYDYDKRTAKEMMNEDIEFLEKGIKNHDTFKDKYQVETFKLQDNSLLVKIYNERDVYVDANCYVKFYDNGKEVDVPNYTYITGIAPHSYGYGRLYDYPNSDTSYMKYQSDEVDVYITPKNPYNSYHCEKDIEYEFNQEEGIIYGVNRYDGYINELEFSLIYYDNSGKIVDYNSRSYYDEVQPNGEFNIDTYKNNGKIEVFLQSALCKRT